jgi:hypothetical protein
LRAEVEASLAGEVLLGTDSSFKLEAREKFGWREGAQKSVGIAKTCENKANSLRLFGEKFSRAFLELFVYVELLSRVSIEL